MVKEFSIRRDLKPVIEEQLSRMYCLARWMFSAWREDTARVVGIPRKTVKSRMYHTRKKVNGQTMKLLDEEIRKLNRLTQSFSLGQAFAEGVWKPCRGRHMHETALKVNGFLEIAIPGWAWSVDIP